MQQNANDNNQVGNKSDNQQIANNQKPNKLRRIGENILISSFLIYILMIVIAQIGMRIGNNFLINYIPGEILMAFSIFLFFAIIVSFILIVIGKKFSRTKHNELLKIIR